MSDRIAVIDRGRFRQIGAPREIYERPVSRFIAGFIGESHFLPVTVDNGAAVLAGRPLALDRPPASDAREQLLAIRPEKLVIVGPSAASALNRFEGTVKEIVYQGESCLIYVTLSGAPSDGGRELVTRQSTSSAVALPEVGAPITLGLAPSDTIVVPAGDGP